MSAAQVIVEALPAPVGAEVRGVDLRRDPPGEVIYRMLCAFREHAVLVIRDQDLDARRLIEISEWFGPEYVPPPGLPVAGGADQPRVVEISNREGGVGATSPLPPHSDLMYMPVPPAATMLYAVEVPPSGGETSFSNLQQALMALAPELRERLATLRGVVRNPFAGDGYGRAMSGTHQHYITEEVPEFSHPVVRTHPDTGRPSLYFSPFVEKLLGDIDPEEETRLLELLREHIDREVFYYQHHWRAGDLLIWDNRCTNHKRAPFDTAQARVMRRLEIAGTRPF